MERLLGTRALWPLLEFVARGLCPRELAQLAGVCTATDAFLKTDLARGVWAQTRVPAKEGCQLAFGLASVERLHSLYEWTYPELKQVHLRPDPKNLAQVQVAVWHLSRTEFRASLWRRVTVPILGTCATAGSLECVQHVVQALELDQQNVTETCQMASITGALLSGNLSLLKWLYSRFPQNRKVMASLCSHARSRQWASDHSATCEWVQKTFRK